MRKTCVPRSVFRLLFPSLPVCFLSVLTGCGLFGTLSRPNPVPVITITANPTSIPAGGSSTLTVIAANATQVTVTGSDGSKYNLPAAGGTQAVSPAATATYTAVATLAGQTTTASASVTVTVIQPAAPTVTIAADPTTIIAGHSSTLTVTATNATQVTVTGTDGSSYTLQPTGGTQAVSPAQTTTYTATATGAGGNVTATATVTVTPQGSLQSIDHVIFMLQENHTFDNYFGMLNPYRQSEWLNVGDDGMDYSVDGIDDKLSTISNEDDQGTAYSLFKFTSTCVDDHELRLAGQLWRCQPIRLPRNRPNPYGWFRP